MTLRWSRIAAEKRWWLGPLAILLALNVGGYAFLVRPLAASSAGTGARAAAAAGARQAAERQFAGVEARQAARRQAQSDLGMFYERVLPASLAAARRLTYASLPALAAETGVSYRRRRTEVAAIDDDSRLRRMTTVMELHGAYRNLREFIYEVERAPEFIVIDDVTLTERNANEPLGLVITLSTFFPGHDDER